MDEHLKADRENNRSPPADALAPGTASPPVKQDSRERGRNRRWKTRREIVLPKNGVARDLRPVNQRRLIKAIFVVEEWNDVVAPLTHFAGGFSKPRLVAIDKRNDPGSGDV